VKSAPKVNQQRFPINQKNKQPAITHRRLLRILGRPKYVNPIREAGVINKTVWVQNDRERIRFYNLRIIDFTNSPAAYWVAIRVI
jgi:hypothetical protein